MRPFSMMAAWLVLSYVVSPGMADVSGSGQSPGTIVVEVSYRARFPVDREVLHLARQSKRPDATYVSLLFSEEVERAALGDAIRSTDPRQWLYPRRAPRPYFHVPEAIDRGMMFDAWERRSKRY